MGNQDEAVMRAATWMSISSGSSATRWTRRARAQWQRDEAKSEWRRTLEPPTTSAPPTLKCRGGVQGGDADSVTLDGVISRDIESLTCGTHVIWVPHISGSLSQNMSSRIGGSGKKDERTRRSFSFIKKLATQQLFPSKATDMRRADQEARPFPRLRFLFWHSHASPFFATCSSLVHSYVSIFYS